MHFFYFLYFLLFPAVVYAYLDPGTGSLLVYALFGITATLFFFLRSLWYAVSSFIYTGKANVRTKHSNIIIYSEGKKYWNVFFPLIEQFIYADKKITYITPEKDDPAFEIQNDCFEVYCPGNQNFTIAYMNKINADIVISTTPHLDIYMWKRSNRVKNYVHLFHSPTGVDFYEKYALSFYDTVLSTCKMCEAGQRELDESRNLPQKRYFNVGCTYFDLFIKNVKSGIRRSNDFTVLYAPTWGENRSSLFTYGIKIIDTLIAHNIKVILRLHPQTYVSHKKIAERLHKKYDKLQSVYFDSGPTCIDAIVNSDILIADFSGMVFDYAYLSDKPILLAADKSEYEGYEVNNITHNQFDIPEIKKSSRTLTVDDVENIHLIVKDAAHKRETVTNPLYNFGCAGQAAYTAICELEKELA